jgi:hypothetical protein
MPLKIAANLSLPDDAVTQTFALLAKRGVGKTHTASVMAEEMLKLGQPIVVYDPTGAWWGLKSSRNGKSPGYPVVVFGGEHADVPLEEHAGDLIASVIVERRIPAILDASLLRKGARIRFMTDFCETLYHKNREPLHFFVDEAQTIAPQNLKAMPEAARLLGAMEDIVLQGRRRGLGLTIISPRPAVVNTNLRSACEVVIAMQIIGPHDRKAIAEWIDLHGDDQARGREMLAGLSSLKRGEAWLWSPGWLELFQRIHVRQRETFDSSATPTLGGKVATPKRVAAVDLAALGAEIQAAVEKAKADDPRALKARIAELERAAAKPAAPAVSEAQIAERQSLLERLNRVRLKCETLAGTLYAAIGAAEDAQRQLKDVAALTADLKPDYLGGTKTEPKPRVYQRPTEARGKPVETPGTKNAAPAEVVQADAGELTNTQLRILQTLAMLYRRGIDVDRDALARWQGIHPNGGRFNRDLAALRAAGLLEGFALTRHVDAPPIASGLDGLHDALPDATKRRIVDVIYESGRALTRDELAELLAIHPNGGRFNRDLAWLRAMKVIPERGPIQLTEGAHR